MATVPGPVRVSPGGSTASAPPGTSVALRSATMSFGDRVLWKQLDLDIAPGEFLAVLGPNGSGKSTLLRVLLGLTPLTGGSVRIAGRPVRRGNPDVGFIPQHTSSDPQLTLRGRDLVALGLDGHRLGIGLARRAARRSAVAATLEQVGATGYADAPVGQLSGGELQRLRVAQALVGDPSVLMCDEPLLSLDLANQRMVSRLIDNRRQSAGTSVLFVTHEINPILPMVDRVLYLVGGEFRIGTPDQVMTSEVLSELYQTEVEVLRVRGRLVVVGVEEAVVPGPDYSPHHTHDPVPGRR